MPRITKSHAIGWNKGHESGIAQAQTVFGLELESEKNFTEAVTWYRKAAAQGEANAMRNLGVCYLDGKGVTKEPAEAANWFRKAADLGNQDAPDDLGDLYQDGIGVAKDEAAAAGWYRKGAERGDGNAMNSLAACYWRGQGVAKSPRDAINWWKKAADTGNDNAKKNLQMALGKFDESGQPRTPPRPFLAAIHERLYEPILKNSMNRGPGSYCSSAIRTGSDAIERSR